MRWTTFLLMLALLVAGCSGPDADDVDPDDGGDGSGGTGGVGTTSPATTGAGAARTVRVEDNRFDPAELDVAAGTTVTYSNVGARLHTVTIHYAGNNGQGGDPATTYKLDDQVQPGEEADYTFAEPGLYHVFCKLHGSMTAGMASVVNVS